MATGRYRVITRIIGFIAIICLIMGLFLTAVLWVAFDLNYYDREYTKLGISGATGMSYEDLLRITGELLNYIKGERDNLDILAIVHGQEHLVFNEREIAHMVDVRDLFTLGFNLRWICLGAFAVMVAILIKIKGRETIGILSASYLWVLGILIVLTLVLLGLIFHDFTAVWNKFHHIFFSNDLWLLDPETDILIQMVPEEFFFDTVMRILGLFGSALTALAAGSGVILFKLVKDRRAN